MRTRGRRDIPPVTIPWLITFSDLMTLLLTFFVLLLSMTSMDVTIITRISSYLNDGKTEGKQIAAGRMKQSVREVVALLQDPKGLGAQQEQIKDLLFPEDVLPADLPKNEVKNNVSVAERPEGIVIVLTDSLLFDAGSAVVSTRGLALLDRLLPVLLSLNSDVNIIGHTDLSRVGMPSDELAARRSLAILDHLLQSGMEPSWFSISGYGPGKPLYPDTSVENRNKNRRIELLIKTAKQVGRYI